MTSSERDIEKTLKRERERESKTNVERIRQREKDRYRETDGPLSA